MSVILEGILVDLVPRGGAYSKLDPRWHNSEAWYWASAGDREIVTRTQLERARAEWMERPSPHVVFGIQTKDGTPIGDISLGWVLPHHRLAMMGAAIGEPDYWGGGFGTDALLLIVDYAFKWLDFHKLWLGTMGLNARVLRQMEKVGFQQEARHRKMFYADGIHTDEVVYGLLREEWPGREAMLQRVTLRGKRS